MSIEIKPGKWRMRNGECAVVEFISGANSTYVVIGYIETSRSIATWTREGKERYFSESLFDLIEPWTDKPVVNWAAMPAWAKWVAMDSCERWCWFSKKPQTADGIWIPVIACECGWIPKEFNPSFTGNWRDSLVERPSA